MAFHALQTIFHHRLLITELVAVAIFYGGPGVLREGQELDLLLAEGTGENFEQSCVNGHAGGSVAFLIRNRFSRFEGTQLRVLHLASFHEWTGAAAVAFSEVCALRSRGLDARFAYVGGGLLEEKIGRNDFTYGIISKQQNPWTIYRSGSAIRRLVHRESIDVIHAHLTFDHWLARLAARGTGKIVRTFHARRPLRDDLPTRDLLKSTDGIAVVNAVLAREKPIRSRKVWFTPPPVDLTSFRPGVRSARPLLGLSDDTPLFGVIGKIAPQRGFEEAIEAFALILAAVPSAKLMILGEGTHRANLERLASDLRIDGELIWAGYHEDDLASYYSAMDVMLFTAAGSDEGHRAVIEAMACGTAVVSRPVDGVESVLGSLAASLISPGMDAAAQASMASKLFLSGNARTLGAACASEAERFGFESAATRLEQLYAEVTGGGGFGDR